MKTIYHLAISRLKYNKGRSILTIVAIALMTTLLMSIGSSALTVIRHQQLEIKESARNYHAAFKGSTADQVFILENHADVESLSTRESVASIELPKLNAVLNFDSTKKGSILVRKKELGILQAIGLSDKQLRQMIHREGLFFTFGTLALSLTIGNGLGYLLVRIIINTQILTISQYEYPITQTLVLIVAVVIGQIAITVFVNRYIHKQSLVERMRD